MFRKEPYKNVSLKPSVSNRQRSQFLDTEINKKSLCLLMTSKPGTQG